MIIPVCWQSRRTEGSACADLNPLDLNCHLECAQREREKKTSTSSKQTWICINTYKSNLKAQTTDVDLLTLVRGRYCYGLCCELVIEVTCVRLWCYLGLEGWNELRRRSILVILHSDRLHLMVTSYVLHLTFFSRTSCQLMEVKNLWLITSLASSGPPPSL